MWTGHWIQLEVKGYWVIVSGRSCVFYRLIYFVCHMHTALGQFIENVINHLLSDKVVITKQQMLLVMFLSPTQERNRLI